jgi:hypothetical protein
MSWICLEQAFRRNSGPVLFLVVVCMTLALVFLWVDSAVGWVFLIAAGSAVVAFTLLGARGGCGAEPARPHRFLFPRG